MRRVGLCVALGVVGAVWAGQATRPAAQFFTDGEGLAAGGYDVVSYFAGKPVKGERGLAVRHGGATFVFATAENRAAFEAEPGKYAPQFGGWCAMGMAGGYKAPTDALAYTVHEGRLYLNYNAGVTEAWRKDLAGNIAKAEKNWPSVREK